MIIFYFSYFFMLMYFFCKKRQLDLNSVAGFSFAVYFFPYLFMSDSYSYPLHLINSGVLLFFIFYVFISDFLGKQSSVMNNSELIKLKGESEKCYMRVVLFISIILFGVLANQIGISGLLSYKTERSYNSHIYGLFVSFVSLGLLYSFYYKLNKYLLFFSLFMFVLFLSGTRTHLVMVLLSITIIEFSRYGKVRVFLLIANLKLLIALIGLLVLGLIGKDLYASFTIAFVNDTSFIEEVIYRVSDFDFIELVSRTEPFHTVGMFNKIVSSNFEMDPFYLAEFPLHFLPVSGPFTNTLHHFSFTIKQEFYQSWGDGSGVAGNFWAEGYATFGIVGVYFFLAIYLFGLTLFNYLINNSNHFTKPVLYLSGVFWVFYIQRNSFFQIISHEKRVIYGFIFILIVSKLMVAFKNKLRS